MFAFFKRTFRLLIGFLLIVIVIWFVAPYLLTFAGAALETSYARLLAILLVVGCWLAWRLIKRLRANQVSARLVSAVLRQAPREQEAQPSAEAVKLRERFEEAVGALAKRGKAGRSLYDLPWYVFIGAPGSGKTTALVNSGLKFPLDQRGGRASVRGVGGTRNCDWWFADEAVFLDTAGRYTTQDSDATSDSEGWREFLALLTKYRKRRPLNGVILTISAQDLLLQSDVGREAHVDAARRRLNELTRDLQIQLPVYVMVTKCDMMAGFSEFFDDLTQEDRAQVWGVTFPYDESLSGAAAEAFPEEFDALVGRLNDRVLSRLDGERGSRRRASIFAFPEQVAALRDPLAQFVGDVFSGGSDQEILLRGVYLTSGTQDGTQIDRLLGSIGRRFGVAPEAVAPAATGRGKAFFVTRLLKDVLIGESGLAGVNTRLERRNAAWQFGAYAAVLLVLVVGLIALFVSYGKNRTYLSDVAADVETLRRVTPRLQGASLDLLLPHLNAVRAVSDSANRYEGSVPWSMRWGLYQGTSVGNFARDAYIGVLEDIVLPRFAARVRQRLAASAQEPERLFLYLKAYLMLNEPAHLDRKLLKDIADSEWRMPDAVPGAGTSLSKHFESLLDYSGSLPPIAIDQTLVAQARSSIKQTSIPQIMLDELRRHYSDDPARAIHLDISAGLGIEKVLARRSGRKLSEPVPSFYTAAVFKEATGIGRMEPLVKKFTVDDGWVWGEGGPSVASWGSLDSQVTALYERDYKRAWDELLNDLTIVPFSTVQQYRDALNIIVGQQSPLRGLLTITVDNTTIVAAASGAPQPGGLSGLGTRITEGAEGILHSAKSKIAGGSGALPGSEITQHFDPIHRLAAGAPAPIDAIFEQIRKIHDQLLTLGPGAGGSSSLKALTDPTLLDMLRTLRKDATNLPSPFDSLVTQIALNAGASVGIEAGGELDQLYRDQVVAECRARVEDRYPFGDGHAGDMSLSDFSLVFGYGGVYDKFFSEHLEKLVNTSQRPWTWRPDSVPLSLGFLGPFEQATRIRQMFFDAGTKALRLDFTVTLSKLDATATRFYVDIDGQRFEAKPDLPMRWGAAWPDPKNTGYALAMFEDRVAQPEEALRTTGPWALFKLIDETAVEQSDATGVVALSLQTRYHRGVITIVPAGGGVVPYATRDWRNFACGS